MADAAPQSPGDPPPATEVNIYFDMPRLLSRPDLVAIYYAFHDLISKHYPDLLAHAPSHPAVAASTDGMLRAMVYVVANDLITQLKPSQKDLVALYEMDILKKCWLDSNGPEKVRGWKAPSPEWHLLIDISADAEDEILLARNRSRLATMGEDAQSKRLARPPNKKRRVDDTEDDDDGDVDMSDVPDNIRTHINNTKNHLRQIEKDQDQLEWEHSQMAVILRSHLSRSQEMGLTVGRTAERVSNLQDQHVHLAELQSSISTRLGINSQHLKTLHTGLQQQHNVLQDLCMQQEIQLKEDSVIIINYDDPNDAKSAADNFLRTIALPDVEIIKAFVRAYWMPNNYNNQLRHLLIELPKAHMVATVMRCFQDWKNQQAFPPQFLCRPALTDTQQIFRKDVQSIVDWWRWWHGKDYRWRPDFGGHVIEKLPNARDRQVTFAELIACQTAPCPEVPAKGPNGRDQKPPATIDPDAFERIRRAPQFRMNCLSRGSKNWRQMMTAMNFQLTADLPDPAETNQGTA